MSVLNWLHLSQGARNPESGGDARLEQAIELVVLGVDARLRLVSGYANRLLPAVENALAHCGALAAAIPGPINLLPDAWRREPCVRALFAQPEEIDELLARSLELLAFAEQPAHAGAQDLYAVISLVRTEQKVLGWARQGEMIHADVPQRTVSFSRHRLLAPSASETDARQEIVWRAFEHLVVNALGDLFRCGESELPSGRVDALLRERLQLLQRARAGLEALHQPPIADESTYRALRQQLLVNGRQLADLQRHANTLEERLAKVVALLAAPEDAIAFGRIEDRLTALNIVASDEADVAADLHLAEISVKGAQTFARATAIVSLGRLQLTPKRMDFSAAERWL